MMSYTDPACARTQLHERKLRGGLGAGDLGGLCQLGAARVCYRQELHLWPLEIMQSVVLIIIAEVCRRNLPFYNISEDIAICINLPVQSTHLPARGIMTAIVITTKKTHAGD